MKQDSPNRNPRMLVVYAGTFMFLAMVLGGLYAQRVGVPWEGAGAATVDECTSDDDCAEGECCNLGDPTTDDTHECVNKSEDFPCGGCTDIDRTLIIVTEDKNAFSNTGNGVGAFGTCIENDQLQTTGCDDLKDNAEDNCRQMLPDTLNNTAISSSRYYEPCPEGFAEVFVVQEGEENSSTIVCDDKNTSFPKKCFAKATCSKTFTVKQTCKCPPPDHCPNGFVEDQYSEECDPEADPTGCLDGLECHSDCSCEKCGNGVIDQDEECDPGVEDPGCPVDHACNDSCECYESCPTEEKDVFHKGCFKKVSCEGVWSVDVNEFDDEDESTVTWHFGCKRDNFGELIDNETCDEEGTCCCVPIVPEKCEVHGAVGDCVTNDPDRGDDEFDSCISSEGNKFPFDEGCDSNDGSVWYCCADVGLCTDRDNHSEAICDGPESSISCAGCNIRYSRTQNATRPDIGELVNNCTNYMQTGDESVFGDTERSVFLECPLYQAPGGVAVAPGECDVCPSDPDVCEDCEDGFEHYETPSTDDEGNIIEPNPVVDAFMLRGSAEFILPGFWEYHIWGECSTRRYCARTQTAEQ